MLSAIAQNKTRFGEDGATKVDAVYGPSEDTLTSSVLGLLFYLPDEYLWKIFRGACSSESIPQESGAIESIEFWPHWCAKGTTNNNFVEPDVFVRFCNFDLIIEAKRWDYRQQSCAQWRNEITAYRNEFRTGNKSEVKTLYLLALGGIGDPSTQTVDDVPILKARWRGVLAEIQTVQKFNANENGHQNTPIARILADLVVAFRIHGFSTGEWLDGWAVKDLSIEPASLSKLIS